MHWDATCTMEGCTFTTNREGQQDNGCWATWHKQKTEWWNQEAPFSYTLTRTHTHTHMGVRMRLINSVQRKIDSQRDRYLHKGLHLVSLRWRWWGEGWPVNMKRYTHYLSVWGWQHTGIMRYTHYHSGAKWTDAMGTVGESPWGSDWEWGLGPGDRCLLTTAATHPVFTS